jgi:hypothetical protein
MQSAVPFPWPESPPRNEWSDWYGSTEPSSPFEPPDTPPAANQPHPNQPPAYEQAPMTYPGHQQPYRPPFEPAAGGPAGPPGPFGPPIPPGPPLRPVTGTGRSRAPLYWSALSVVVVAAVVLVLLLHPFSHHETISDAADSSKTPLPTARASVAATASTPSASPSASLSPSATASASVSATAVTEQQSASNLAGMLASSVTDRTAINDAYNDVYSCGPNLHGDAAVFTRAVSSRRTLLASLAAMPGRSALPPALLSELTKAWQASMAADQGFATWATDQVTQGCVAGDTSDPAYQTTVAPDNEATQDKTAFAAEWNPIASGYGLTTYQQGQL